MLPSSPSTSPQINFFDISAQLNATHPLLALGRALDWQSLESVHEHRQRAIKMAVVDRGYRGAQKQVDACVEVLLPKPPLKRDTLYQRQNKRILCRKRAAIEPIIGHLKQDYRLSRNGLKGSQGDAINLLMAACAWNLRKWMVAFFLFEKSTLIGVIWVKIDA